MAKLSKIARNEQRKDTVKQYADKRTTLKATINSPKSSVEEVDAAVVQLQKLPRNASPTRVRNRCSQTGRSRGFLRKFGVSRITFRDLALAGQIPGVTKSSW